MKSMKQEMSLLFISNLVSEQYMKGGRFILLSSLFFFTAASFPLLSSHSSSPPSFLSSFLLFYSFSIFLTM